MVHIGGGRPLHGTRGESLGGVDAGVPGLFGAQVFGKNKVAAAHQQGNIFWKKIHSAPARSDGGPQIEVGVWVKSQHRAGRCIPSKSIVVIGAYTSNPHPTVVGEMKSIFGKKARDIFLLAIMTCKSALQQVIK